MSVLLDLADFVQRHGACGALTGDATEVTAGDYELTLACPCSVVFLRWVTVDAAVRDLVYTPLLVTPS